jgi:hypothetical protein
MPSTSELERIVKAGLIAYGLGASSLPFLSFAYSEFSFNLISIDYTGEKTLESLHNFV